MDELTVFERQFVAALQDYARSEEGIDHVAIAHRAATQGSLRRLSLSWRPSLSVGLAALTMVATFGVVIALLTATMGPANPLPTSLQPLLTPSASPEMPTASPSASPLPTVAPTSLPSPTASALPTLGMPGSRGSPPGLYGWQGEPLRGGGMHLVQDGREATAIGFGVGRDCLIRRGNPEPEAVEIGNLDGLAIEPYAPVYTFGSAADGDEVTRAYALDVGDTTLCIFLTWHATSTEEEIASAVATIQSLRAEPFGGRVRIVFETFDIWDTG